MIHITRYPHTQMFRAKFGHLDRGHEFDPFPYDIVQDPHRPFEAFHPTHFPSRHESTIISEDVFEIPSRFFLADHRPEEKVVRKE